MNQQEIGSVGYFKTKNRTTNTLLKIKINVSWIYYFRNLVGKKWSTDKMTETKLSILWSERKTENDDPNSHFGLSLNYISSHFGFFRRFRLQMICIFKFRHDRTNVYNWEGLQTYIMESCLVANFCETEFQLGILKMTLIPVPARLDSDSKDQNTIERRWLMQKSLRKILQLTMIFKMMLTWWRCQSIGSNQTGAILLEQPNWSNSTEAIHLER